MSSLPPVIEQADAMLARVASLNLQAAEHVHACLLDTTEPEELARLSRAAAQLSRSLRQNLALLARLQAGRARAAREAEQHAEWLKVRRAAAADPVDWPEPDPAELAQALHIGAIQAGVVRVIARVADGDRRRETALVHRFDRELDDWLEAPDFLDHAVDTVVRHACRVLDLPPDVAAGWRDLPDPAWSPDPAPCADATAPDPDPDRVVHWPPDEDIVAGHDAAADPALADSG